MTAAGFGAIDKLALAGGTMTGELVVPDVNVSGLTGATAATRYVGGTTSGAPITGTFAVGDFVIDHTGKLLVCVTAGNPGVWVAPTSGMSNPMTTLGDLIYENVTPAPARLAGNTTATKNFLTQTGTGTVSAVPAWGTIAVGDVPALNQNTTGTAANVTGVVAIGNGGTGQTVAASALGALGGAPLASPTFTGNVTAPDYAASGIVGATSASRHAGATTSGAPTANPFLTGDFVIAQNGAIWVCTASGSPGTWAGVLANIVSSSVASIGTGGTIPTAGIGTSLVTTTTNVTGVILAAGTFNGQQVSVVNESANTITFNTTPSTSHMADAATQPAIGALTARQFVWVTAQGFWYRMA